MSKHKTVGDVPADLQAALDRLEAAKTAGVATINTLKGQVKTNMTPAEVADMVAKLGAVAASLEEASVLP